MHLLIEAITPQTRLLIEIVNIGKMHARPKALLDDTHAALNFAFGLRSIRFADAWSHPDASHEVCKERIPFGGVAIHLQEHAFHAIGEGGFGQASKVLQSPHHAANHRGGIAAFDKGDEAHAAVN